MKEKLTLIAKRRRNADGDLVKDTTPQCCCIAPSILYLLVKEELKHEPKICTYTTKPIQNLNFYIMNSSRASTIVSIELGTEIQQPENLNSANGILRILTFIFCARLLPPWTPGGENRPNAAQPRSASVNQDSDDRLAARQKSRDLEQSSGSRNQFAILRRLCIADSPVQRKRHGFKFEPVSTAQSLSGADADEGAFRKRCRNIRLRIGSPTSPSVIPTGAPSALAR